MIGVVCSEQQIGAVREFFQLFKTPWELAAPGRSYDALIIGQGSGQIDHWPPDAGLDAPQLVIAYQARPSASMVPSGGHIIHDGQGLRLPIYCGLAELAGTGRVLLRDESTGAAAALVEATERACVLRVGYDLFSEAAHLLGAGQPAENAALPALDLHIALLRRWIIQAGLPLVEIPPSPWGYPFIASLTHDVDFVSIRQQGLGHSFWGFLWRAVVGSAQGLVRGRVSWNKAKQNWAAVASLPLVYLSRRPDFWDQFASYAALEGKQPSTFFLIPFRGVAGERVTGPLAARRATRYDIDDVGPQVQQLAARGCEIGLHGLDAWHSVDKARQERTRIAAVAGQSPAGVRMHWLCCDTNTPVVLEQAGFAYDATCGYNETVGFRAGTLQVFQPPGAASLLELPLHIQDTALFYPGRMGLSEAQAWERCQVILDWAGRCSGVITVLWHQRSLAPERLWGDFYADLLDELRQRGAWLATAGQAVDWFRQRRSISFERCQVDGDTLHVALHANGASTGVGLALRVHRPGGSAGGDGQLNDWPWQDIRWAGERSLGIRLPPATPEAVERPWSDRPVTVF